MNGQSEVKADALARTSPAGVMVADVQGVRVLAKDLIDSGLFPAVKNVAGAVTIIQAGLELGIPPVAALNTMAIINGRLAMEAKALLAIAQSRAGVTWRVTKEDATGCEITFSRPGWGETKSSFTKAEAQDAGLLGKTNWKLWPKDMYFARAAGRGIRRIAPDAVLGLYTKEEMNDSPTNLNGPATAPAGSSAPGTRDEYEAMKSKPLPRVKDEFEDGPGLPANTEPEAAEPKRTPNPDIDLMAEAEAIDATPANEPPAMASLEAFGKVVSDLKALSISEDAIWTGIHRYTADTFKKAVVEVSDFTTAELDAVNGYLSRKLHATKADRAKKEKS